MLLLGSQVGRAPGSLCSRRLPQALLLASVALGDVQPSSGALGHREREVTLDTIA